MTNTKYNKNDIKYFLYHNNEKSDNGNTILKYFMAGIYNKNNQFVGIIHDYVGGGQYQDFYFLDGQNLSLDDTLEDGDMEDMIDKKYNGLIDSIYNIIYDYAIYLTDEYTFGIIKNKLSLFNEDNIINHNINGPKIVGHTGFNTIE